MNKYQFHFGDYYNDGHGRYITLHCLSPKSEQELRDISAQVLDNFPELDDWVDNGLCINYGEYRPCYKVWKAIQSVNYPRERVCDFVGFAYDQHKDWEDMLGDENLFCTAEFVADIWIWFMNYFGAELTIVEDDAVHFNYHFGYGCFD